MSEKHGTSFYCVQVRTTGEKPGCEAHAHHEPQCPASEFVGFNLSSDPRRGEAGSLMRPRSRSIAEYAVGLDHAPPLLNGSQSVRVLVRKRAASLGGGRDRSTTFPFHRGRIPSSGQRDNRKRTPPPASTNRPGSTPRTGRSVHRLNTRW